jgi:ABC-type glutathione transport system ATPase component
VSEPVLRARGLVKTYGNFTALDDVSFELAAGKTLGVVGESGSGKSTLVKLVMRLLPADRGEVRLAGHDLFRLDRRALRRLRRLIQLVPQDPRTSLNPTMTVRQSLNFQLGAQGVARGEWEARSARLLEQVSLPADYIHAYPHELSGGQAQRVAIARAIANEPEVLVCDEAVSALDKSVQAQVLNTLADLQAGTGVAILFITHDLAVVEHLSDDILVLEGGRAVEAGPTEAVLTNPTNPYARELLATRTSLSTLT